MLSLIALLRRLSPALWTIIAVGALAAFIAIGGRSWLHSHDAAVQLAATLEAQKKIVDQDTNKEHERDSALVKTLAGITEQKRQVQTATEVIAQIPATLPPLPDPVSVSLDRPTDADPVPAAVASVPQSDLKPLYDYVQDCRACQAKLATAQGNFTDEQSKIAALTTERDVAIKAAKSQGFWNHVKRDAKWFVIGATVAAVTIEANRR